jgi:hypothetical protein
MSYKTMLQEICQKNAYKMPIYDTINAGYIRDSNVILWRTILTVFDRRYETPETFRNKKDSENYIASAAYNDYIQAYELYHKKTYNIQNIPIDIIPQTQQLDSNTRTPYNTPYNTPELVSINHNSNINTLLTQLQDIDINQKPVLDNSKSVLDNSKSVLDNSKSVLDNSKKQETKYIVLIDLENVQPTLKHFNKNIEYYCFYSSYTTVDISKYKKTCIMNEIAHPTSEAADHLITYNASKLASKNPNHTFIILSNDKSMSVLQKLLTDDNINTVHINKGTKFTEYMNELFEDK